MSRNIMRFATIACVIALIACGALILVRTIHVGMNYANAEQYTAGGTTLEGAVRNLDIHWTDGSVTLARHAGNTIEIAETAPGAISGDRALRWWLDGDTLRVQYAKSGFFSFTGLNKALTVTLPEDADLNDLSIEVTSGEINLDQPEPLDGARISCTSGNIRADLADVRKLAVDMTSGDIQARFASADEVSLSSTSGAIDAAGEGAKRVDIGTTSGNIALRLEAFDEIKIDATSGDITAALPTEPGYRVDVDTTSGSFDYSVPLAKDGGGYTCGDGSGSLSVHVTSGDVKLTGLDAK